MTTEVFTFKLTSGEEIIARVLKVGTEESPDFAIEKPMVIMLAQMDDNRVMPVPVAPWILLTQSDAVLTLRADLIMHTNPDVPDVIEKRYLEQTSGIALS